jgi:hypothetical protein
MHTQIAALAERESMLLKQMDEFHSKLTNTQHSAEVQKLEMEIDAVRIQKVALQKHLALLETPISRIKPTLHAEPSADFESLVDKRIVQLESEIASLPLPKVVVNGNAELQWKEALEKERKSSADLKRQLSEIIEERNTLLLENRALKERFEKAELDGKREHSVWMYRYSKLRESFNEAVVSHEREKAELERRIKEVDEKVAQSSMTNSHSHIPSSSFAMDADPSTHLSQISHLFAEHDQQKDREAERSKERAEIERLRQSTASIRRDMFFAIKGRNPDGSPASPVIPEFLRVHMVRGTLESPEPGEDPTAVLSLGDDPS